MRLDQYLSHNLSISRKQAQTWVKAGWVQIEGQLAQQPAQKILPGATVVARGETVVEQHPLYLMLHKPAGTVSATRDSIHPTVLDCLPKELANTRGLQVVGRLDKDTTGLLLLTTDGQWNHRITSPTNGCTKWYKATLALPIEEDAVAQLSQGIQLHNEPKPTQPAQLQVHTPKLVTIGIQEGKYHQVKRMFAAVGNRVDHLHRFKVGALELPDTLAPGHHLFLTEEQVRAL